MAAIEDALTVAVLVLGYLLLLQAMTAAVILLCEFILLRVRVLRSLLAEPGPDPAPAREVHQARGEPERPRVRIGGPIRRWD
jgi:hypothetical protein